MSYVCTGVFSLFHPPNKREPPPVKAEVPTGNLFPTTLLFPICSDTHGFSHQARHASKTGEVGDRFARSHEAEGCKNNHNIRHPIRLPSGVCGEKVGLGTAAIYGRRSFCSGG